MGDLFDSAEESSARRHEPLAARMRPRTLDEYIGQDHIVGKGRLLRRAIAADQLTSVIFYGPPGSGKTTLARVIANHTSSNFLTLNAVLTGVADIRRAISDAEDQRKLYSKKTILFVDEVHRWNKSQQDALLPWVENGTIILIGATTENPFFEVNKALVSRSRVFQLKPLTKEDLMNAAKQALSDVQRGYGHWKVEFEEGALEHLVDTANGDARSLLNALELAVETTPEKWDPNAKPPVPSWGSTIYISKETAEESIQKKVVLYDRDGDYHYDIISAFIKSLRGRDPDAACYWLARMVKAGEDPDFIFRRMLISACEDTGLADPHAIEVVTSCAQAFDRVGMPEGRYFLAHAALYLATAPKSNSSMAFFDALASVEKEDVEVPNHLRDASRDAEGFGHGAGYLYPHAYRDHWVAQQYLPNALVGRVFYTPSTQGYEAQIREEVLGRRELQIAALLEEDEDSLEKGEGQVNPIGTWWEKSGHWNGFVKTEENLTFSPEDKKKNALLDKAERSWRSRLDFNRSEVLMLLRDSMIGLADLKRHHRSLVWNADDALLIFDVLRKTPEGLTCGTCRTENGMALLNQYASTLGDLDKPLLSVLSPDVKENFQEKNLRLLSRTFGDVCFDRAFFRDIFASKEDVQLGAEVFASLYKESEKTERDFAFDENSAAPSPREPLFAKDACIILSQRIPCHGQRLSKLIVPFLDEPALCDTFVSAENEFFVDQTNPLFNWDADFIQKTFEEKGFTLHQEKIILSEKRRITEADVEKWFNPRSAYGEAVAKAVGPEGVKKISTALKNAASRQVFTWKSENVFFVIKR